MALARLTKLDFRPQTFDHLRDQFASKVPLRSSQFAQLEAQERATAFRIAGVENAATIASVRERIGQSLVNGDFRAVMKDMRSRIASGDFSRATTQRLSIVYKTNVSHSWASARRRLWNTPAVAEAFPFAMYVTSRDRSVRRTHRALDGLVFPKTHPFWNTHEPPWEWG